MSARKATTGPFTTGAQQTDYCGFCLAEISNQLESHCLQFSAHQSAGAHFLKPSSGCAWISLRQLET